jgi:purine-binding chemotaxis protein CheW
VVPCEPRLCPLDLASARASKVSSGPQLRGCSTLLAEEMGANEERRRERACLLCRARARLCALPLLHVVETMRPLQIDRLAGMPEFVLGLSMIRGESTLVVDCATLLGDGRAANPGRFVTLRTGERTVALAVEEVLGITDLSAALRDLPPLLRDASHEVIAAIGTLDAELLLVLNSAQLVPHAVWQAFDARMSSA